MSATHLKDATYREKFKQIDPFIEDMVSLIKKDLRTTHLTADRYFANKYFPGKQIAKLTVEELAQGYRNAIQKEEKAEEIGEYFFHRWLLKNTDIYKYFEEQLTPLAEDFTEIKEMEPSTANKIKEGSLNKFGTQNTYIFSLMNGVAFDDNTFKELHEAAINEKSEAAAKAQADAEQKSFEQKIREYQTVADRLTSKYEEKLSGWERKYDRDVSGLKKQIAHLQRQLNELKAHSA